MSVLARVFEEAGLTTVAIALVREHAERVRPPRALWVPFYFGYTMGKPDDPDFQHQVLAAALDTLDAESGPVLADYPEDAGPIGLPQASEVTASANGDADKPLDAAGEITALRGYYERWQEQRGRTAVGVTGIPQRRFRGIIRFLLRSERRRRHGRAPGRCVRSPVRPLLRRRPQGFLLRGPWPSAPETADPHLVLGRSGDSITQRLNATDARLQATAYGLSRYWKWMTGRNRPHIPARPLAGWSLSFWR